MLSRLCTLELALNELLQHLELLPELRRERLVGLGIRGARRGLEPVRMSGLLPFSRGNVVNDLRGSFGLREARDVSQSVLFDAGRGCAS